jgi:hypothetical protein
MPDVTSYADKLKNDLPEQFKGKPNLEALLLAIGRQLSELRVFFESLETLISIELSEGAQLDGIGELVNMSRPEALRLVESAGITVPMNDAEYRDFLKWKIALNVTDCTHKDVYTALKMFWRASPLYYSEDPEKPATIIFSTPELRPEDNASSLFLVPRIKAAGVAVIFIATTATPMGTELFTGAAVCVNTMITTLPEG